MGHTDFIGPDGEKWPSVTQIVNVVEKGEGLYRFYGEHGYEKAKAISQEAKEIGSQFHDSMESFLSAGHGFGDKTSGLQGCTPTNPLADACVREFCAPYVTGVRGLEKKVVNETRKYHGTYDCELEVHKLPFTKRSKETYSGLLLVDWKSANNIYDINGVQLGGYYGACTDLPGTGAVVRVDKKTKRVYWKVFFNLRHHFDEFLHLRSTWDFIHHQGAWAK